MMVSTTRGSAERRGVVVASEPLFPICSEDYERRLRFRLSYRSGVAGAVMDYDKTGQLPVHEAEKLCELVMEREAEDFKTYFECMRHAMWGKA